MGCTVYPLGVIGHTEKAVGFEDRSLAKGRRPCFFLNLMGSGEVSAYYFDSWTWLAFEYSNLGCFELQ